MKKRMLLPWTKNGNNEYVRHAASGLPAGELFYFYVWYAPLQKAWRCPSDSRYKHVMFIDYATAEEAMAARDKQLEKEGWILLNEKTALLI